MGTDEDVAQPPLDPSAHDAARRRGPTRLLLFGGPATFLVAFVTSAIGTDGRAGLVLMLLLLALVFAVAGLWLGVQLLLDEFRGDPTSLGRGLFTAAMFLATLMCMIAFGGVVASAGAPT